MQGERCSVYVAETATGEYFTWCDDPVERSVMAYGDPRLAILAGLQRAAWPETASTPEGASEVADSSPDD